MVWSAGRGVGRAGLGVRAGIGVCRVWVRTWAQLRHAGVEGRFVVKAALLLRIGSGECRASLRVRLCSGPGLSFGRHVGEGMVIGRA